MVPAQSLGVFDLPLLIFGGLVDGQDIGLVDSLALTFGVSKKEECWNKIGINQFNCNCLLNNMVKHKVVVLADGTYDVEVDPLSTTLIGLEPLNTLSCNYLNELGLDQNKFHKAAPKIDPRKKSNTATQP